MTQLVITATFLLECDNFCKGDISAFFLTAHWISFLLSVLCLVVSLHKNITFPLEDKKNNHLNHLKFEIFNLGRRKVVSFWPKKCITSFKLSICLNILLNFTTTELVYSTSSLNYFVLISKSSKSISACITVIYGGKNYNHLC